MIAVLLLSDVLEIEGKSERLQKIARGSRGLIC